MKQLDILPKTSRHAYNHGYQTFDQSRPLSDNPYPSNHILFSSWVAGWLTAKKAEIGNRNKVSA